MEKLISVIIPVYNVETYLELCDFYYDSILEETDADMRECLAVECARRALHGTGFESVAKDRGLFKRHTDMAKKCLPYIRKKRLEYTVFSYCPWLRNFLRSIKGTLH